MTLMSSRKSLSSLRMAPSRKPWDRPSVAPGFMAASSRGYSLACRVLKSGIEALPSGETWR